ncbi:MAG: GAF domain-containing protein, partial [bacterium]
MNKRDHTILQEVVNPEINKILPALLNNLLHSFSENKSIREVACDICSTVLSGLREYLDAEIADFCGLFGYIWWLEILKLKGADGFIPSGFNYNEIKLDEGFIGRVAARKRIAITRDLQAEKNLGWVDHYLAALNPHVAMLAMPLVLDDGKLVGVFVIGKFYDDVNRLPIIFDKTIRKSIKSISEHITTIYYHAIQVVKGNLAKKYVDNERKILATAKRFYIGANPNKDPIKFMEMVAKESLKLLNSGNPANPYFKNFLFYEYQEYTDRYLLRTFGQPKYDHRNFAFGSWIYKKYVQDGYVKSIESQNAFVTNRGKYPHVIRFIPEKVEQIIVELDANWSPAGLGCAFFVPLFDEEEKKPLGVLVFLSARQRRRYIQQPEYFLSEEKRKSSLNHLKYFRSLQPFIAREYQKLQLEDRQRIVAKLENILTALKEIILLEDRTEVLDRLADFATKSLDCEACIIYLLDDSKSYLECVAFAGVQAQNELKISTTRFLKQNAQREAIIPLRILKTGQDIFANSANQFRRLAAA